MGQELSNNTAVIGATNTELSKEDIVDLLAEETPEGEAEGGTEEEEAPAQKPEKDKKKEKKEEKEEEEEEEGEGEEKDDEEEEPEPDELNLVTPVKRKEILAKYPNLFKDFPYLQSAYYRDQQFTEVFPTVEDAKEAQEKAQTLDNFEQDIMQGNLEKVLSIVKQNDPNGFNQVVDNYLVQLGKVDKDAVHHIIGNVVKNTVINVLQAAHNMGEERGKDLKEAAILFYSAIFGSDKIEPPTNLGKANTEDPEKEKLRKEKEEFVRQKFESARDTLNTKVQNSIKATISNHIDPRNTMPEYVRKNAIRDAIENLENLLGQDRRFSAIMDKHWKNAFDNNFSNASIEQIRSTYLSKAKALLPSIIKNARNEASKASRLSTREEKDRNGPLPIGRHTTTGSEKRTNNAKSPEIPKGMKTYDFLNSD